MSETSGTQRGTQGQGHRSGVEEQVDNLLEMFEEQEAQVWAYAFGAIIAVLIGLVVAYYAAQSMRENRKSTIERLRDSVREGLGL